MAKNQVAQGDIITMAAPATVVSGQGVLVGDLFGVALDNASSGADVALAVRGVWSLPKAAGSINPGVRVFWDNTAGRVTTTATSNRCIGWHAGKVANAGGDGTGIDVLFGGPNAVAA